MTNINSDDNNNNAIENQQHASQPQRNNGNKRRRWISSFHTNKKTTRRCPYWWYLLCLATMMIWFIVSNISIVIRQQSDTLEYQMQQENYYEQQIYRKEKNFQSSVSSSTNQPSEKKSTSSSSSSSSPIISYKSTPGIFFQGGNIKGNRQRNGSRTNRSIFEKAFDKENPEHSLENINDHHRHHRLADNVNNDEDNISDSNTTSQIHVVFSTSCSEKQHWQAYLFFFQAFVTFQQGTVTRIASGCSERQKRVLTKRHHVEVSQAMNDQFFIHFTPDFSPASSSVKSNTTSSASSAAPWHETKYWNKPFGLKHWMEYGLGYRTEIDHNADQNIKSGSSGNKNNDDTTGTSNVMDRVNNIVPNIHDDDIIVLVDPDMLMQRPFVNDFSKYPIESWRVISFALEQEAINRKRQQQGKKSSSRKAIEQISPLIEIQNHVSHGRPIAQQYGFGAHWLDVVAGNLPYILFGQGSRRQRTHPHLETGKGILKDAQTAEEIISPVQTLSKEDARVMYAAGPPYMLTGRDMYRLTTLWVDTLPRLFEVYPQFMAEMYAYSLSAAHLNLKHQLGQAFMVSTTDASPLGGEDWSFIETIVSGGAGQKSGRVGEDSKENLFSREEKEADTIVDEETLCDISKLRQLHETRQIHLPHVIHYCQRYSIGEHFFSKYKLPTTFFFSCDFPLLAVPPSNISKTTNYSKYGDGTIEQWAATWNDRNNKEKQGRKLRMTFMVCTIYQALNQASRFWKNHHCGPHSKNHPMYVPRSNKNNNNLRGLPRAAQSAVAFGPPNYNQTWTFLD